MKSFIALVPARGGSKRIPRKNALPFLGTPAVVRTVRTIRASGVADRIVVSTDDDEIAKLAEAAGAEVPGLRPAELANDYASTIEVVLHAVGTWMTGTEPRSALMVVYPTAVLLSEDLLRGAADTFLAAEADFLVPVLRYPHPVERRLRIDAAGMIVADEPQHLATRTQDLEPAFHDAGQFYIGRLHAWVDARETSPLASGRALAWELPADSAVDIDEPEHWARAERLAAVKYLT